MRELLPDRVLRYDDREDAVIDVHLPTQNLSDHSTGHGRPLRGPRATTQRVVFLIHGGFWKQQWDRTHTRSMARALAKAGYVVATPEYRRVGGSGGWPVTGDDVQKAFERVTDELTAKVADEPSEVIAVGHSAGGQLALWLAAQSNPSERIDRVVALAPVADLHEAAKLHLGDDAVAAFMGQYPAADADPMTLFETSPHAEVRLVHGGRDDLVPVQISRNFVARHPWATLQELPNADHFDLITPGVPVWPDVLAALSS